MTNLTYFLLSLLFLSGLRLSAQPSDAISGYLDEIYPDLEELYIHLHQNPELSLQEENTARLMADNLKELGFEV